MSKIIIRPSQCAARCNYTPPTIPYCTIDGSVFLPCPSMFEFPIKCPLLDGITIQEHLESVLKMHKKPNKLAISHKRKKRNRKDCICYSLLYGKYNRCNKSDNPDFCVGVSCGNFETK